MRIVDLSQDIYEGMMVYPGHSKTALWNHASHEETAERFESGFSFQTKAFTMNDNGPTHVDSFSHLDPGKDAATIDQMDLGLFVGPCLCVDVSDVPPRTDITPQDLDAGVERTGQELAPGDILLLYTATWNRFGGERRYLTDFPGLGQEASDWVASHRIKAFGVDSPTPDNPASRTYPCHMMSRRARITHYENLAHLDEVVNTKFLFVGLPLKLRGGHGGPTRAAAIYDL